MTEYEWNAKGDWLAYATSSTEAARDGAFARRVSDGAVIHNDADDAVPWYQGIEFINALRRLGKEGYMFNYNGERYGLRNRDNQKHWTVHMDEFFDHYLLGRPRPEWMDTGVPYLERGTRDVSPMFERTSAAEITQRDR